MVPAETIATADALRSALEAVQPDPRSDKRPLSYQHERVATFELSATVPLDIRVHFETAKNLYLYAWFVYRFYPVADRQALATLEFALRERLAQLFPHFCGPSAKRPPSLKLLFEKARKEKLISNAGMRATERWAMQRARGRVSDDATRRLIESGAEFIEFDPDSAAPEPQDYSADALSIFMETLPAIRNTYAHGSAMLHPMVLGTFEIVTDLVNQLYPAGASEVG